MKTISYITAIIAFGSFCSFAQVPSPSPKQTKTIVLSGGTAHIGNGEVLENSIIILNNGKITSISKNEKINIYNDNTIVYNTKGKHIYPGLILPLSDLGLNEIGSVKASNDATETGILNSNVRSITAYNAESEMIPVLRSNGILIGQIIPSGGLISGSSSVVQLDAWTWEDAVIKMDNNIHLNWPQKKVFNYYTNQVTDNKDYSEQIIVLKKLFDDAFNYNKTKLPDHSNLKLSSLCDLFKGEKGIFIEAGSNEEIVSAVNFVKGYGINKIVIVNVTEDILELIRFIKSNGIQLVLSTPHRVPNNEDDDVLLPFKLPSILYKEGINVSLSISWISLGMSYPFLAGTAAAYGLTKEEALQLITINPAKAIGVEKQLGTIEEGKDATIIISEGDILDIGSNNITQAFINGREINLDNKHKYLNRKYNLKYSREK